MAPLEKLLVAKTNNNSAEEWLPLWMHAKDTAGTMLKMYENWLPENIKNTVTDRLGNHDFLRLCTFVAYIHDIGKATALFQSKICLNQREALLRIEQNGVVIPDISSFVVANESPHAKAGEAILLMKGIPLGVASIVGSHHAMPREIENSNSFVMRQMESCHKNYFGPKSEHKETIWKAAWDAIIADALLEAGYTSTSDLPQNLDVVTQVLVSGMLIMADWIASNTTYFPLIPIDDIEIPLNTYPGRVNRAWETLNLPKPWIAQPSATPEDDFLNTFGFAPNKIQEQVLRVVSSCSNPGIFILEAQMGLGKTEAAISAAEIIAGKTRAGGIFFGLPTQATANGIFPRLEAWAEKQSMDTQHAIRLAHGAAELNDAYQSLFKGRSIIENDDGNDSLLMVHQWFEGRKQALLANFVIGTVDQMLMAGQKQRHFMLRHLGLAGKVLIIDECHAYDAYMNRYMDRVLNWMGEYNVPVIVLSATLPPARRASLVNAYLGVKVKSRKNYKPSETGWENSKGYPLLTWTDGGEVKQCEIDATDATSTSVTIEKISDDDIADTLRFALADGGSAGVIVNTVKRAQNIAHMLQKQFPDKKVILIHSRFLQPDRSEKESEILSLIGKHSTPESRDNLIIVGTQVLEQSLDIDFDFLISDLCPMDLLLQRLGRLHRHRRIRPAS